MKLKLSLQGTGVEPGSPYFMRVSAGFSSYFSMGGAGVRTNHPRSGPNLRIPSHAPTPTEYRLRSSRGSDLQRGTRWNRGGSEREESRIVLGIIRTRSAYYPNLRNLVYERS